VEIPTEMVPIEQKRIIQLANRYTKPVITATQMLESMIDSPVPTRAEATDIANSILDGTDVMMLSGETAVGKYPIEAVKVMDKIAKEVEKRFEDFRGYQIGWLREFPVVSDKSEAIAHSCWDISETLNLNLIVTPTATGGTAKRVSKYRPRAGIIGIASDESTFHKLGLVWGVVPLLMRKTVSTDKMFDDISELLLEKNIAEKGETIVITAGIPWGISGTTNLIKIHTL
ncbi:MAG TPA: pyruvate kinase, partial [Thermotogales bacterium]|nr:pyruvate kinase [Thermotogales bacterium]